MRKISAIFLVLLLVLSLSGNAWAAADKIVTAATGYTSAGDVEYVTVSSTVVNWGARGEDCVFLTTYAENYYIDDYSWDTLSQLGGGTGTSDAYTSQLYLALQGMMKSNHTKQTSYGDTRHLYRYTDCLQNDHAHISSFYSGKIISGTWDQGATWNREHTWPSSKTPSGKPKNGTISEATDIMTLRPTAVSENSNRGNTAFGESSGYFDPGESIRGDCARIVLYGHVRWGNTSYMWGSTGVMENLDILLKWMAEDPVDTWEMGRNDAVQSITGVRNVFVDYPEYAWLLFGQEVPEGMTTPSGSTTACEHTNVETRNAQDATCAEEGFTGDTYCADCGELVVGGSIIPATGEHKGSPVCALEPTCTQDGYVPDEVCADCNLVLKEGYVLPATGEHTFGEWLVAPGGGQRDRFCTVCNYTETEEVAYTSGFSGNLTVIIIAAAAVVVIAGGVTAIVIVKKKKA